MRKPKTKNTKQVHKPGDPLTSINPYGEPLTIEKIREFPGHEHLRDKEAETLLANIATLADILYDCIRQEEDSENDKSQQTTEDNAT